LILGVGVEVKLNPRSCSHGFIYTFKFTENGRNLVLLHRTTCEDIPTAFNEYEGRLIAGVGSILKVYEMG
jgi:splicing factor 3B subunit 3